MGTDNVRDVDAELRALRERIDAIDDEVLVALSRRAELALAVGRLKRKAGRSIYDPERERALLERMTAANPGPLGGEAVRLIYQRIIQACRNLESPPRVAFLGPQGTFSHQAALRFFGPGLELMPQPDLPDVAEAVARGEVDYGLLPVENSIEGAIGTSFDLVVEHDLTVVGELIQPVELYLVGNTTLDQVRTVYSHPQPLRQARRWLRGHVPRAALVPVVSTADAAARLHEPGAAAIVGPMALEDGQLQKLAGPIEDRPDNRTRFWVVARRPAEHPPAAPRKSSLMLVLKHESGTLARALGALAAAGVNLTQIASRPVPGQHWDYRFFLDVEGDVGDATVAAALRQLQSDGAYVRVLGVYSAGEAMP